MTELIKVSKTGFDASTETNPNNLNYSSEYNTLKYFSAGSISIIGSATFPNTSTFFGTVTHNLGFYPYNSVFISLGGAGANYYQNAMLNVGAGLTTYASTFIGTGTLRFFMSLTNTSGGTLLGTVTYFYKLFRNNLNL